MVCTLLAPNRDTCSRGATPTMACAPAGSSLLNGPCDVSSPRIVSAASPLVVGYSVLDRPNHYRYKMMSPWEAHAVVVRPQLTVGPLGGVPFC